MNNLPERSGYERMGHILEPAAAVLVLLTWAGPALSEELPRFDCVITPFAMADVSSAVPGTLQAVHLDRGGRVEQGQVVAELDSGVERASLALARMRSTMEHEVQLGRISLAFDERERERLNSLYKKKVASFHDKDRAERDAALSKWKLRQARDVNKLRQLELLKAEEVLKQKTVRSPIEGVVVERYKSAGEYVEDQPIMRIAQLDPLNVEAIVPMQFFGKVQVGMAGEVVPETVLVEPHRATVTVVDWMGNAASGTFGVRLELTNPEYRLPAGQKCTVRFLPDAEAAPTVAAARTGQRSAVATDPVADAELASSRYQEEAWPEVSDPVAGEAAPVERVETTTVDQEHDLAGTDQTDYGDLPPELPYEPIDESSGPVVSTDPILPTGCLTVGPMDDADQVEQLSMVLYDRGFRVSRREDSEPTFAGYMVVTPPEEGRDSVRQLAKQLKERGIRDMQLLRQGPRAWHLSLGVYKSSKFAILRRDRIASLGVETEIQERTKLSTRWWLDMASDSSDLSETKVRQTLVAIVDGLEVMPIDCPSILTAQR